MNARFGRWRARQTVGAVATGGEPPCDSAIVPLMIGFEPRGAAAWYVKRSRVNE
jgi:hypothetical protein